MDLASLFFSVNSYESFMVSLTQMYTVCAYMQQVVEKDPSPPRMTVKFPTLPTLKKYERGNENRE